jgi:hypothetical protein
LVFFVLATTGGSNNQLILNKRCFGSPCASLFGTLFLLLPFSFSFLFRKSLSSFYTKYFILLLHTEMEFGDFNAALRGVLGCLLLWYANKLIKLAI